MKITDPGYFGTTTFEEGEVVQMPFPGDPSRKVRTTVERGQWRPPARIATWLDEGCVVPLNCYTGSDGMRRIVPRCNFAELIDLGAAGGRAVLHGIRGFNHDWHDEYRGMQLIHQYVVGRRYRGSRGMQEHLTRSFDYARDLFIRRLGRPTGSERNVLPKDIGQTPEGEGERLSVARLIDTGREAAREAKYRNPTNKSAIKFGLYEAAKMNPLDVEPQEVPALVRAALFDTEAVGEPPSEELIENVKKRFWAAVRAHESDTSDDFYRWFQGPDSSLVKQIAKQKGQPGGELARDDVRRTLLHLAMEAYTSLGECIHALMRTIKNSIPNPLNDTEKTLFEHMHESQIYYGNLPAALLADRMHDVQRAVLEIWSEPQDWQHVRVLHRLLYYYEEMARERRRADALSKKRCAHNRERQANSGPKSDEAPEDGIAASEPIRTATPTTTSPKGGESAFIENRHSNVRLDENPFDSIADHIRELRAIKCKAGCLNWEYYREGSSDSEIQIRMRCECGEAAVTVSLSAAEFAEHGKKVMGWQRRMPRSPSNDGPDAGDQS